MIDRLGPHITIASFTMTTILGLTLQAHFAAGAGDPSFAGHVLGRAIFGFGAEGMLVWFA
jgi:hypothetical protein